MSDETLRRTYWLSTSLLAAGMIGAGIQEWVYAGFSFDFGGAIISHSVVGDTLAQTSPAIFFAALLALSYYSYRTRRPVISG